SRRLVPDELWARVEPLVPAHQVRPQGGGRSRVDDRAVFTAIVFVLTSGCAWRHLPPSFGVKVPTAHRRFTEWTKAGLWRRLHRAVLDELGSQRMLDWSCAVLDGASVRAKRGDLWPVPVLWTAGNPARRSMHCPTGRDCRWRSRSRPRTPTTRTPSNR